VEKDFSGWHKLKTKLQEQSVTNDFFFNPRDVWLCSLGVNLGAEEDGKNEKYERPILIIKKFNNDIFLALPLTSKIKNNRFYHQFEYKGEANSVILSQIRLLDKKRLFRKAFIFPEDDFREVMDKLKKVIFE
jgi:mRNA interferase MazF